MCEFSRHSQQTSSPATSDSSASRITCTVPPWPFSFGTVLFSLRLFVTGFSLDDSTFDAGFGGCSSYLYASNSGFCVADLACLSCERACETECALAGASDTQIVLYHKYGVSSVPPSITCSGTCPCTAASSMTLDSEGFFSAAIGTFSDGDGDYASNSHCAWVISASSQISLQFTEFDLEEHYDFVIVNSCSDANCTAVQQIARLSGTVVGPTAQYKSSTGWMQVIFSSDDLTNHKGFEALVTFAELQVQEIQHAGLTMSSPLIFLQQSVQGVSESTRSGSSGGGSIVEVAAVGLDSTRNNYECVFFRMSGAGWENMTGQGVVTSASILRCPTPEWGSNFTAGNVAVGIRMGGEDLDSRCSPPWSCNYRFFEVWESFNPHSITASGSDVITIVGSGFDMRKRYSANFSSAGAEIEIDSHALVRSTTELIVTSRAMWQVSAADDAILHVYMLESRTSAEFEQVTAVASDARTSFIITDGVLAVAGRVQASAAGGDVLTIDGFGFRVHGKYRCAFSSPEATVYSTQVTQISERKLSVIVPIWRQATQQVLLEIYDGTRRIRNARLHLDGFTRYNVTENLHVFIFSELLAVKDGTVIDRLGGTEIEIRGAGFHTSEYLCLLVVNGTDTSDVLDAGISGAGAGGGSGGASSTLMQGLLDLTPIYSLDREHIFCTPPPFDLNTTFADFTAQVAIVRVYERQLQGDWTRVFSSKELLVSIVQINRAPAFVGSTLTFYGATRQGDVTVTGFVDQIVGGLDASLQELKIERTQRLTFEIQIVTGGQLFSRTPTIHANGTAVFPMVANKYGIVIIAVSLRDDGGRENGGHDFTIKSLPVEIHRNPLLSEVGGRAAEVIELYEVQEDTKNILPRFRPSLLALPFSASNFFSKRTFNVSIATLSMYYFTKLPEVFADGTLTFQLKPGAFGVAQLEIHIRTEDIGSGVAEDSKELINVSVAAVNSIPVFFFNHSTLPVMEDECMNGCEIPIVANISASHFTAFGPRGEDWPEKAQSMTFVLVSHTTKILKEGGTFTSTRDLSDLLSLPPVIYASDGKVKFNTVAHVSGETVLVFVLQDSGGVAYGGVDTSAQASFRIRVSPVNDAPLAILGCGSIFCSASCATEVETELDVRNLNVSRCNLTITVIADNQHVNTCFQMNILLSSQLMTSRFGSIDESHQPLEMWLQPMMPADNMTTRFFFPGKQPEIAISPALSAENKSSAHLSLCVVQNTTGRLSYIVYLSDGTDSMSPGVIILEVQPSNRAPSFHLCAACANSELLGAGKCCEGTVTVREGSGRVSVPGFTRNISAGNLHTQTGYMQESQNVFFSVAIESIQREDIVASDPSYLFKKSGIPTIDTHGTLSFELLDGMYGKVTARVWLQDDGGTEFGGLNVSTPVWFTIYVIASVASVDLTVSGHDLNLDEPATVAALHEFVAQEFESPLYLMHLSVELITSDSALTENVGHSIVGRHLLAFQEYQVFLLKITLFSWSTSISIKNIERTSRVIQALQQQYTSSNVNLSTSPDIVKTSATRNTFDIDSLELVLLESRVDADFIFPSFFSNIVATDARIVKCEAAVHCTGTCACSSPSSSTSGTISDGPDNYVANSHCVWVIASGSEGLTYPCSDIKLTFSQVDTEAMYDTVKIYACTAHDCMERKEIGSLDGNEHTMGETFTSGTGFLQVVFSSDEVVQSAGFEAQWTTSANGGREIISLESTGTSPAIYTPLVTPLCNPTCDTADLRITSKSFLFGKGLFNFTLGMLDTITKQVLITVLPVNDAPSFSLATLIVQVHERTSSTDIQIALARNISKGPLLKSGVTNENNQNLTFRLVLLENSLDSPFPFLFNTSSVDTFGVLHLRVPLFFNGLLKYNITLSDDGGTENGGSFAFTDTFWIEMLPVNQRPSFTLLNSTLSVHEAGESYLSMRPRVVILPLSLPKTMEKGPSRPYPGLDEEIQELSFALRAHNMSVHELLVSSSYVNASTGLLHLSLNPYQNGLLSFDVVLSDDGVSPNASDASSFTLLVLPVNDPPRFELVDDLFEVLEYQSTVASARHVQIQVATAISHGPPLDSNVENEDHQIIRFTLTPLNLSESESLFEISPFVHPNGTLDLVLRPYQSGMAMYSLILSDDGNSQSLAKKITIRIADLNNEPRFELTSAVFEALEVKLTTANLRFGVATNITTGPPLPLSVLNERHQKISFTVSPMSEAAMKSMFVNMTMYSNGTLDMFVRPYVNGNVKFSVVLNDDGGTAGGGRSRSDVHMFQINIVAVNNPPFFRVPPHTRLVETKDLYLTELSNFASVISKGPPIVGGPLPEQWEILNEQEQSVSFTVVLLDSSASGLVQRTPVITAEGVLHLYLTPYMYGEISLIISLVDDGGTENGGINTSRPILINVSVASVNNAPFFKLVSPVIQVFESTVTVTHRLDLVANGSLSKGPPILLQKTENATVSRLELSFFGADLQLDQMQEQLHLQTLIAEVLEMPIHFVLLSQNPAPEATFEFDVHLLMWPETTSVASVLRLKETLSQHYILVEVAIKQHAIALHDLSGALVVNEDEQHVSFQVSFIPAADPVIAANNGPIIQPGSVLMFSNGSLTFQTSPYTFGNTSFHVLVHDDGGTERGGINISAPLYFVIQVLPVNDAPSFQLLQPFVQTLETEPGFVTMILVANNISRGPPLITGIKNEDTQDVTFVVSEAVDSFASQALLLDVPHISTNGTLMLHLKGFCNGTIMLNITLKDTGGMRHGGHDVSHPWQLLTVHVLPVNQPPSFSLPVSVIYINEAPSKAQGHANAQTCRPNVLTADLDYIPNRTNISIHAAATQIVAGPFSPEENKQTVSFVLKPLQCRIPSNGVVALSALNETSWVRDCPSLYGGNADGNGSTTVLDAQLFQTGTQVQLTSDGTLVLSLEAERFGTAAFLVKLEDDGAALGSVYGASDYSSPDLLLLIVVDPVNNQPSFQLPSCKLRLPESTSSQNSMLISAVVRNITHGGWREADTQKVFFIIQQIDGPAGVVMSPRIVCSSESPGLESPANSAFVGVHSRNARSECNGSTGALSFFLSSGRWGNVTLNITLSDDGGGGVESFFDTLELEILPVNNAPTFRLGMSTVYASERGDASSKRTVLQNFADAVYLGPWEDSRLNECLQTNIECEQQRGNFVVTTTTSNISALIFEDNGWPEILSNGTLTFTLRLRANSVVFGRAMFTVILLDQFALDGTTQESTVKQFDFIVSAVNSPPTFQISQSEIEVEEDSGNHDVLVATNMRLDGSLDGTELDQSMTFLVMVDVGAALFSIAPRISQEGILSFKTSPNGFGFATLSVTLQDSGGRLEGGNDMSGASQPIFITVIPINDRPLFMVEPGVARLVLPYTALAIAGFATQIQSGPSNEMCRTASAHCQSQKISFEILDVTNPTLFESMPVISDVGTLTAMLANQPAGSTTITFRVLDDGALYNTKGYNESLTKSVTLTLTSLNTPPFFSLPWQTRCAVPSTSSAASTSANSSAISVQCSCDQGSSSLHCISLHGSHNSFSSSAADARETGAVVFGKEGAAQIEVHNFATDITPAVGVRVSSDVTFAQSTNSGLQSAQGLYFANVKSANRSRYHVAGATTKDQTFLYVAEATDSVAAYKVSEFGLKWLDRRSQREDRIRFGLEEGAEPGSDATHIDIQRAATASSAEIDGRVFVGVASGAISIPDTLELLQEQATSRYLTHDIDASALGHWDFSLKSVVPGSRFFREINHANCKERGALLVAPAAFEDFGQLGNAVLQGPKCKALTDWDQNNESFSVHSFLANNGDVEAIQMTDNGLVVADDISNMTMSVPSSTAQLPTSALSVSVWMSISAGQRGFAALVAAAQADVGCNVGFVLGYTMQASTTVLQFDLALSIQNTSSSDRNTSAASSIFAIASISMPQLEAGVWYHIAATYDGLSQRIYLDGELVLSTPACIRHRRGTDDSCGAIVYPNSATSTNCQKPTAFTLGTYINVASGDSFPHRGLLKEVKIHAHALLPGEILTANLLLQSQLKESPVLQKEYWVQKIVPMSEGVGRGVANILSPSRNYVSDTPVEIMVLGVFMKSARYLCRFSNNNIITDSNTGVVSCRGCSCADDFMDTLTCTTPRWQSAAKDLAAVLSVIKVSTETAGSPTFASQRKTSLWQRVCLEASCGFVQIPARKTACSWWLSDSTANCTEQGCTADASPVPSTTPFLSTRLIGIKSVFRFFTISKIFSANSSGLHFVQDILGSESARSTSFEETLIQGAYSVTFFHRSEGDTTGHFMTVANFWDGMNFKRKSSILRIVPKKTHVTQEMNSYARFSLELVREISTDGARKLLHFSQTKDESKEQSRGYNLNSANSSIGHDYIATVNYLSASYIYPFSENLPEQQGVEIPGLNCATDVTVFTVDRITYLAFSVFWNPICASHNLAAADSQAEGSSSIFSFSNSSASPTVSLVHDFVGISRAHQISYFELAGRRFLAFAGEDEKGNAIFAAPNNHHPPVFVKLQNIPSAMSVSFFVWGGAYLLLARAGSSSSMLMRWTGDQFLGPAQDSTLPRNSAGGQVLPSVYSMGALHIAVSTHDSEASDVHMLLIGSSTSSSKILRGARERVQGLKNPVALKISPHDDFVYVAAQGSRSIAVFRRDTTSGLLTYLPNASYNTDWTGDKARQEFVMNPQLLGAGNGFPLRGLAAMEMNGDGSEVVAASMLDSTVVFFARDEYSGALSIRAIIRDGDVLGGRVVDGLAGARSIALSSTYRHFYVAGWLDQAVAAFARSGSSDFVFLGRVKEGERVIDSFKDTTFDLILDAPSQLNYETSWSNGKYPMRLGGNGHRHSFSARDSMHFVVDGVAFLAVASSSVDASSLKPGAVFIYMILNSAQESGEILPTLLQTLHNEASCISLTFLAVPKPMGVVEYFMVVGNSYSVIAPAASLNVYKWSVHDNRFIFHHSPSTISGQVAYVSKVSSQSVDGSFGQPEHLLAVANFLGGESTDVDSVLYRWHGAVNRFEVVAPLPGSGATSIALVMQVDPFRTQVLLSSILPGACGNMSTGTVSVYGIDLGVVGEGVVRLIQCIESRGTVGLHTFNTIDGQSMFAVSQRQSEDNDLFLDYPLYSQNSSIYVWGEEHRQYRLHQVLGSSFQSLPDSSSTQSEKQSFCAASGAPGKTSECHDSTPAIVPGLRGLTSMHYFESDGEGYLALAQSACPLFAGEFSCEELGVPHPQSAVLQYDKANGKFTEMKRLTEGACVFMCAYQPKIINSTSCEVLPKEIQIFFSCFFQTIFSFSKQISIFGHRVLDYVLTEPTGYTFDLGIHMTHFDLALTHTCTHTHSGNFADARNKFKNTGLRAGERAASQCRACRQYQICRA